MNKVKILTELDEAICALWGQSNVERELLIVDVLAMHEYGVEDQVQEFLDSTPDATFMDVDNFIDSITPSVEIVDDDELDEDD